MSRRSDDPFFRGSRTGLPNAACPPVGQRPLPRALQAGVPYRRAWASGTWANHPPPPPSRGRAAGVGGGRVRPLRFPSFEASPFRRGNRARPLRPPEPGTLPRPSLRRWDGVTGGSKRRPFRPHRFGDARETPPDGRARPMPGFWTASPPAPNPELWEPALIKAVSTIPGRAHLRDLFGGERGRAARRKRGSARSSHPRHGRKRHMVRATCMSAQNTRLRILLMVANTFGLARCRDGDQPPSGGRIHTADSGDRSVTGSSPPSLSLIAAPRRAGCWAGGRQTQTTAGASRVVAPLDCKEICVRCWPRPSSRARERVRLNINQPADRPSGRCSSKSCCAPGPDRVGHAAGDHPDRISGQRGRWPRLLRLGIGRRLCGAF